MPAVESETLDLMNHRCMLKIRKTNTTLPSGFGLEVVWNHHSYNHHHHRQVVDSFHLELHQTCTVFSCPNKVQKETAPNVSFVDRKSTAEALLTSFVAEHSLPFTMAPHLIQLASELVRDPRALQELSMERTTLLQAERGPF